MTIFTVEITNESHLAGITAARLQHNSVLPATISVKEPTGEMIEDPSTGEMVAEEITVELPNPDLIDTDADYVQFVMSRAAESYANQYGV